MMIVEQDSRTAEGDAAWHYWMQKGAEPAAVKALLPALVNSRAEVRQRAQEWLAENALTGSDLSDSGVAQSRQVVNAARRFAQAELDRGSYAGEPAFKPGNRYGASEADLDAELERQSPTRAYPGMDTNNTNLRLGELEAQLQAKYRDHSLHLTSDGRVTRPDGTVVERVEVPSFGPQPLQMRDTSPSRAGRNGDGSTFYKNAGSGEWDTTGQNRPYWLDED